MEHPNQGQEMQVQLTALRAMDATYLPQHTLEELASPLLDADTRQQVKDAL